MSYVDPLLRSGYQIKTRWAGEGATTLWGWGDYFETVDEAVKYKQSQEGKREPSYGWKLEVEIFRIERITQ